jgi:hypothetical protein
MINESELREAVLELVVLAKKTYEMAHTALEETAAVREVVRPLDPAFDDLLPKKQEYYRQETRQTRLEIIGQFESIYLRVKEDLIR